MDGSYLVQVELSKMMSPGKQPKTQSSHRYLINGVNNSTALQMDCRPEEIILSKNICKASGEDKKLAWYSVAVQTLYKLIFISVL